MAKLGDDAYMPARRGRRLRSGSERLPGVWGSSPPPYRNGGAFAPPFLASAQCTVEYASMPKPDLLTPIRPLKDLHPQFVAVMRNDTYEPARGMLREVYAEFPDPDGNFVEPFQTSGFDSRTFELSLLAMFRDLDHRVGREPRLDFILTREGQTACVEAGIASPPTNDGIRPYTHDAPTSTPEELQEYREQEMVIRLGSSLFSKLQKKYWNLPQAQAGHLYSPYKISMPEGFISPTRRCLA